MWELDYKDSWALKNWCFWTVVLEKTTLPRRWCRKTVESTLDCKEIQPVHPKGNQSWIFIGRTDAEAETPILWSPDAKSWLIWKDSDAGKDWRQEKGTTEDEMVGWHHKLKWTWVWVNSGRWWWTGGPGMLQSMGSQESDATEVCMHVQNFSISAPLMLVPEFGPLSLWAIVGLFLIIWKNQTSDKLQLTLDTN